MARLPACTAASVLAREPKTAESPSAEEGECSSCAWRRARICASHMKEFSCQTKEVQEEKEEREESYWRLDLIIILSPSSQLQS